MIADIAPREIRVEFAPDTLVLRLTGAWRLRDGIVLPEQVLEMIIRDVYARP